MSKMFRLGLIINPLAGLGAVSPSRAATVWQKRR